MQVRKLIVPACLASLGLGALAESFAAADPTKDAPAAQPAAAQPEMKLPPGWTAADMQAYAAAATPGEPHKLLAADAGTWQGKQKMYMPGAAEPMTSEVTSTVTPIMNGRYTRVEVNGDMPGMGPYTGLGLYGYDNVAEKFVCTWVDNHGTGMMRGEGELSPDGQTLTWTYDFHCPVTKKPSKMRQVETNTGKNTKTMEMFGPDPKTGKEYKMMTIEMTRKSGGGQAPVAK